MTLHYIVTGALVLATFLITRWLSRAIPQATVSRAVDVALASTHQQVADAETRVVAERERADRYFAKIQDFESERDQWQRLYMDQSIGHANAQNLMMGTINELARRLEAKGVQVKLSPALQQVRDEFRANHEDPARQMSAGTQQTPAA